MFKLVIISIHMKSYNRFCKHTETIAFYVFYFQQGEPIGLFISVRL